MFLYKVGEKYCSNQPSKRASVWGRLRPAHSSYLGMGRRNLCLIALASLGLLLVRVRLAAFVVGETVRARFGLTVCALSELFRPDGGTSEASAIDKDSL